MSEDATKSSLVFFESYLLIGTISPFINAFKLSVTVSILAFLRS